jgi:outer membrane lipoprotein-sorting protein
MEAAEPVPQLRLIQRELSKIFSLKGEFLQDFQCSMTEIPNRFSGTFELKRKGRYRFNYLVPSGKHFVSDGTFAYVYDSTAGIVILNHPADTLLTAVADLLVGESESNFNIHQMNDPRPTETGLTVLRLIPIAPHPFIRQVLLTISASAPYVRRIIIVDNAGCFIRTTLNRVSINTGIRDKRFRFTPPKNAVILSP